MNRAVKGIVAVLLASCGLVAAEQGRAHTFPVYLQERAEAQKAAPKPAVKGIRIEDRLTGTEARDAVRQGHFAKVHVVQLEAGDYQIDLMSNQFDATCGSKMPRAIALRRTTTAAMGSIHGCTTASTRRDRID